MDKTIKAISTKELVDELSKREGVSVVNVDPYNRFCADYIGPLVILAIED